MFIVSAGFFQEAFSEANYEIRLISTNFWEYYAVKSLFWQVDSCMT